MKTASAAKIAAQFNNYLEASQNQPVLITRNGKPVAIMLAVHDEAEAEQVAGRAPRTLRSIFQEANEQLQKDGGIPEDEFWRQVAKSRSAKRATSSRRKRVRPGR